LDVIPGFQGKFLSDGITVWASTSPAAPSSKIANVHFVKLLDMIASQSEIVDGGGEHRNIKYFF